MIGRRSADSVTLVFQHGSLILPDRIVDAGVVECSKPNVQRLN